MFIIGKEPVSTAAPRLTKDAIAGECKGYLHTFYL